LLDRSVLSHGLVSYAQSLNFVVRNGNQFVFATHDGNTPFGPWFVAYTAPSPTGPFSGPRYLHKAPEPETSTNWQFPYDAQLHQEFSQQLLRHEAVHTWQTTFFAQYSSFVTAYAIASVASWKATGTVWRANKFETDANLYWGGDLGPYGGTRDCY